LGTRIQTKAQRTNDINVNFANLHNLLPYNLLDNLFWKTLKIRINVPDLPLYSYMLVSFVCYMPI